MSGIIEFDHIRNNYDYGPTSDRAVYSDIVSAGGHDWRVTCFPNDGDFASVYLELMSEAKNVTAVFDAAVFIDRGRGDLMRRRTVQVYNLPCIDRGDLKLSGFPRFLHMGDHAYQRSHVSITWAVAVVDDDVSWGEPISDVPVPPLPTRKVTIAVPPSDMADNLGRMLDSASLTDVSFVVDDGQGHTSPPVHAHRALLAARSPVFQAALCGHMLEAKVSSTPITVRDMDPDFIYTDHLPTGVEDDEAIRSLLAAADRYALHRLKLFCAKRLLDNVSVSTVAGMMDFSETYNCPELKTKCIDYLMDKVSVSTVAGMLDFAQTYNSPELTTKCIDYLMDPEIFMEVALTDGYMELVARSPSIVAEIRKKRSEHNSRMN